MDVVKTSLMCEGQVIQVSRFNFFLNIVCTNLEFGFISNMRAIMNCDVTTSCATEQLRLDSRGSHRYVYVGVGVKPLAPTFKCVELYRSFYV